MPRLSTPPTSPTPLLCLAALVLLLAVPSLALTPQLPSGLLESWRISDLCTYQPLNSSAEPTVYVIDRGVSIRALNGNTGLPLPHNLSLDASSGYWHGIAASPAQQRVVAIQQTPPDQGQRQGRRFLVALTADLRVVSNVSIDAALSPPPQSSGAVYPKPLLDSKGNVYIVVRAANYTVTVNPLTPDGKPLMPPWQLATTRSNYKLALAADQLYFHVEQLEPSGTRTVNVTTTDGKPVRSLRLNTTGCSRSIGSTISVDGSSGDIAMGLIDCVVLSDSSGARKPAFRYAGQYGLRAVTFVGGRLAGTTYTGSSRLTVLSATNGDLLAEWAGGIADLSGVTSLAVDQRSRSLYLAQYDLDSPAIAVDVDRGVELQQYSLPPALDECYPFTSDLSGGHIHWLLACPGFRDYTLKLLSVNHAGQLVREVSLSDVAFRGVQQTLLVDEQLASFYLITARLPVNQVVRYAFNGSRVSNFSDARIGDIGYAQGFPYFLPKLARGYNASFSLAVTDPAHRRIVLLDLATGAFLANVSLPAGSPLLPVAAVYDSHGNLYRSEVAATPDGDYENSTIRLYAPSGAVLAEFVLDREGGYFDCIALDSERGRLFASNYYHNSVAWWQIPRVEQLSSDAGGEVRAVQVVQGQEMRQAAREQRADSMEAGGVAEGDRSLRAQFATRGGRGRGGRQHAAEWLRRALSEESGE